jgi:hypothetical protein
MWGLYCLQTNKIKYAMISSLKELYNCLLNDFFEVHDIQFLNEFKAQIFYSEKEEMHLGVKDSNVALGSFVTCYGRMRLYEELFKIDEKMLKQYRQVYDKIILFENSETLPFGF